MKISFLTFAITLIVCVSLNAQIKAGLLCNNKVLTAVDTIALSYPADNATIFAVLLDTTNGANGTMPVQWAITGSLTIIDTPYISYEIFIDASQAMNDQLGFVSAQALTPEVTWVTNKVFLKIKGKNSKILRDLTLAPKQDLPYPFKIFTVSGQRLYPESPFPLGICIVQTPREKTVTKTIRMK